MTINKIISVPRRQLGIVHAGANVQNRFDNDAETDQHIGTRKELPASTAGALQPASEQTPADRLRQPHHQEQLALNMRRNLQGNVCLLI